MPTTRRKQPSRMSKRKKKRKALKPVSRKRHELLLSTRTLRDDYAWQHPHCQTPGCPRLGCDIHEIARGPARRLAVADRSCWLHLCRQCHEQYGDYSIWPIAAQLAVKKIGDPENYCRQRVNELRGRQPDAITEEEVDTWVQRLLPNT